MEERKEKGWVEGTKKEERARERKESSYTCPETLSPNRTGINRASSKQVVRPQVS